MLENYDAQCLLDSALREMESFHIRGNSRSTYMDKSYINSNHLNYNPEKRFTYNQGVTTMNPMKQDVDFEKLSKENQKLRQMIEMLSQDKQELSSDLIVLRKKLIHYESEVIPRSMNGTPVLSNDNSGSSVLDLQNQRNHSKYCLDNPEAVVSPYQTRSSPRGSMMPNLTNQARTMSRHQFEKYPTPSDNLIPYSKKSISLNELYRSSNIMNTSCNEFDDQEYTNQYQMNEPNHENLKRIIMSQSHRIHSPPPTLDRHMNMMRTMSQSPKSAVNEFHNRPNPVLINKHYNSDHDFTPERIQFDRRESLNEKKIDFSVWDRDSISAWLYDLGLGYVVPNVRKCIGKGDHLLKASKKDLEKELGLKNPLHLKKLLIHMSLNTSAEVEALSSLRINPKNLQVHESFSIETWLENIGLSNYYVNFEKNLIDGYVLDLISVDDLLFMEITNEFHVSSLKRGIQLLRALNYDLSKYRARPETPKENRRLDEIKSLTNGSLAAASAIPTSPFNLKKNGLDGNNEMLDSGIMYSSQHSGIVSPQLNVHSSIRAELNLRHNSERANNEECNISSSSNITLSSSGGSGASRQNNNNNNNLQMKANLNSGATKYSGKSFTLEEVTLWTQFMIMNWLKDIELKEFVSSCRGKGLHGALFVLEDRFNSTLLADILNIPPSKTLLRRHLEDRFKELIGLALFQRKLAQSQENAPLTLSTKIKSKKKLFFNKKKRIDEDFYLLCPYNSQNQSNFSLNDFAMAPSSNV